MSFSPKELSSFVNGAFVQSGSSTASAHLFQKLNPYTSEILNTVASADMLQVVTAIQAAQKFFLDYKSSSLSDRKVLLVKIKNYIQENADSLAAAEALQQGLNKKLVLQWNIGACLHYIDQALAEISSLSTEVVVRPNSGLLQSKNYSPVGVTTILASWNLSLRNIFENLIPAIAAGNTCVVKVSSHSPATANILAQMILACDLPKGLIQVVLSNDPTATKALATHPSVKAVVVIGSLQTAQALMKDVAQVSGQSFKKIKVQTGSKNSAIALTEPDQATFDKVMESFLFGQGQLVWNSTRLFVLEKNEQAWVDQLKQTLSDLRPAESIEDNSLWGPIVRQASFNSFQDVMKQAQADQGHLLQTPKETLLNRKNFLPITFTKDMSNCSTLQQDQIHSPLFILSTVKYPFDIPKYTNVSYFGYAAHIFGDPEKMKKVTDALDVGLVTMNKWSIEHFGSFKAVKQSGFGIQDCKVFGDFFSNVKILTN